MIPGSTYLCVATALHLADSSLDEKEWMRLSSNSYTPPQGIKGRIPVVLVGVVSLPIFKAKRTVGAYSFDVFPHLCFLREHS